VHTVGRGGGITSLAVAAMRPQSISIAPSTAASVLLSPCAAHQGSAAAGGAKCELVQEPLAGRWRGMAGSKGADADACEKSAAPWSASACSPARPRAARAGDPCGAAAASGDPGTAGPSGA
jgi:hypothetical protein